MSFIKGLSISKKIENSTFFTSFPQQFYLTIIGEHKNGFKLVIGKNKRLRPALAIASPLKLDAYKRGTDIP